MGSKFNLELCRLRSLLRIDYDTILTAYRLRYLLHRKIMYVPVCYEYYVAMYLYYLLGDSKHVHKFDTLELGFIHR
jgi:hypothetical protein